MNRLTNTSRDSRNCNAVRIYCDKQTALKKLYEYENTGLTPQEVENLKKECKLIDGYNCSLCGASQADIRKKYSNYCSNCGAKIQELKGGSDE
jgi:hypothetical protein